MTTLINRRALFAGLATVTAASPALSLSSPEDRLRVHFDGLADAMNEITRDTCHGWLLTAGERNAMPSSRYSDGWNKRWFNVKAVRLARDPAVKIADFFVDQLDHNLLDHLYHDEPSTRPVIYPIGIYRRD